MQIDFYDLVKEALEANATHAAMADVSKIQFREEVRELCVRNSCGNFDTNWMGPPAIGPIKDLMEKARKYRHGLLFQTVCNVKSSFDLKGMNGKTNRIITFILILILPTYAFGIEKADMVLVVKSESKMYLIKNDNVLNEYKVVFGANPKGHKQKEGDERTPEGSYILDYKKDDSAFYKAIHISYPNEDDIRFAKESGVKPGGAIMIHGLKDGLGSLASIAQYFNWTDGCIAVSNSDMDEIWESVNVGTPIEIKP